jgi:hypothetical protein
MLEGKGVTRDNSYPFGIACYHDKNGGWLVIDESYTWQDTDMLIEDCVTNANECYGIAAIIQSWVEEQDKGEEPCKETKE